VILRAKTQVCTRDCSMPRRSLSKWSIRIKLLGIRVLSSLDSTQLTIEYQMWEPWQCLRRPNSQSHWLIHWHRTSRVWSLWCKVRGICRIESLSVWNTIRTQAGTLILKDKNNHHLTIHREQMYTVLPVREDRQAKYCIRRDQWVVGKLCSSNIRGNLMLTRQ
jgi:hypothetical protein